MRAKRRRRSFWRGDPAAFVVAYTFALVGVIAFTGFAAVDLGLDPAWLVAAAAAVVGAGALAVVRANPRALDDGRG
jgi:hypothetical protein